MGKDIISLGCPRCGAPLENLPFRSNQVKCKYCQSVVLVDSIKDLESLNNIPKSGLKWISVCNFPDDTCFVTDGSILINTAYLNPTELLPSEIIPSEAFISNLNSPHIVTFEPTDLKKECDSENVSAPNEIILNQLYIDFLLSLNYSEKLIFRANGTTDPIILFDGDKKIGVLMPMELEKKKKRWWN